MKMEDYCSLVLFETFGDLAVISEGWLLAALCICCCHGHMLTNALAGAPRDSLWLLYSLSWDSHTQQSHTEVHISLL
jgi:hypothetical protein